MTGLNISAPWYLADFTNTSYMTTKMQDDSNFSIDQLQCAFLDNLGVMNVTIFSANSHGSGPNRLC